MHRPIPLLAVLLLSLAQLSHLTSQTLDTTLPMRKTPSGLHHTIVSLLIFFVFRIG